MISHWVLPLAFLLLFNLGECFTHFPYHATTDPSHTDFNWNSIEASSKLRYTPCYDYLECARLEVPLDWSDESNNNTAIIAVAKIPARVSRDDPSFGGTVVLNPGGPGGSGVGYLCKLSPSH
jgi:hypothetical protein